MTQLPGESPLAVYQRHLKQGALAYQYSLEAKKPFFYPRIVCPYTGSNRIEWRTSRGLGTIYAATYLYPKDDAAYAVVLIDVDEGFRLMSRIIGTSAENVTIGARVRLTIQPAERGEPAPFFRLDDRA